MKRLAMRVVQFLTLGVIVSVAVAWGFALDWIRTGTSSFSQHAMSTRGADPMVLGEEFRRRAFSEPDFAGKYDLYGVEYRGPGLHTLLISRWIGYNAAPFITGDFLVERESGWPTSALRGQLREAKFLHCAVSIPESWSKQPISVTTFTTRINVAFLPLLPIWPGFAINTIFYAAILWMMFAFPSVLRRRRRIKRGLCPACAYPIGKSAVCTECGAALKKSREFKQSTA